MTPEAIEAMRMVYGRLRGIQNSLSGYSVPPGTAASYIAIVAKIESLLPPSDKWEIVGLTIDDDEIQQSGYVEEYIFKPKLYQLLSWIELKFGFEEKTTMLGSLVNEISDNALKTRSIEIMATTGHFDIPVSQATLVLEDRIRKKSKFEGKKSGVDLINEVIKADPMKSVIKVSDDPAVQEGFANICRGMMQFHRNETHHHIIEITKEDAMKICAYIDLLLKALDNADIRKIDLKSKP